MSLEAMDWEVVGREVYRSTTTERIKAGFTDSPELHGA
jgi:acetyl-CoA carboxylase alpha subunit